MKKLFLAACLLIASAGVAIAHGYDVGSLSIGHPWTRPTPAGAPNGGGYMTITNKGSTDDRLVGGRTPAATRVEIHEMSMDGGVMRMRKLAGGLALPAGETVTLAPGGYHVMFIGLKAPFRAGDSVPVTLDFQKAGSVTVEFRVQATSPADHDHGGGE